MNLIQLREGETEDCNQIVPTSVFSKIRALEENKGGREPTF